MKKMGYKKGEISCLVTKTTHILNKAPRGDQKFYLTKMGEKMERRKKGRRLVLCLGAEERKRLVQFVMLLVEIDRKRESRSAKKSRKRASKGASQDKQLEPNLGWYFYRLSSFLSNMLEFLLTSFILKPSPQSC